MRFINLQSGFIADIVSKMISKNVRKKIGHDINVQLKEFTVENANGLVDVHISMDAAMTNEEFKNLIKTLM